MTFGISFNRAPPPSGCRCLLIRWMVVNEDIIADPMRLNQILLNILSNAIKFTQTGGTIALRIAQTGTSPNGFANYEFRVRDNGIGMSAEFKEHIFEQFAREKTSTVSKIQGTGLGMSITKSLVDMMGGTITVESEVGKGTEFLVSLRFPIGEKAKKVKQIPQLEGFGRWSWMTTPTTA